MVVRDITRIHHVAFVCSFACLSDVNHVVTVLETKLSFADHSAEATIAALHDEKTARGCHRALRALPQASLPILKAGCQRLFQLAQKKKKSNEQDG